MERDGWAAHGDARGQRRPEVLFEPKPVESGDDRLSTRVYNREKGERLQGPPLPVVLEVPDSRPLLEVLDKALRIKLRREGSDRL